MLVVGFKKRNRKGHASQRSPFNKTIQNSSIKQKPRSFPVLPDPISGKQFHFFTEI